jgi:hypothetical protein
MSHQTFPWVKEENCFCPVFSPVFVKQPKGAGGKKILKQFQTSKPCLKKS